MKFYLISPPKKISTFNKDVFDKVTDLLPVKYFQFRPKFNSLKSREEFVKNFYDFIYEICSTKKIKIIINDDFEIAQKFIFDGIHLGQNDKSCSAAKKKFGKNYVVGISCSDSFKLYEKAYNQGADYVAFGPAFQTKNKRKKNINLSHFFKIKNKIELPFVFIGGINHDNIKSLKKFGPNYIAIIDSLWNFSSGPIESAKKFREILNGEIENENDC